MSVDSGLSSIPVERRKYSEADVALLCAMVGCGKAGLALAVHDAVGSLTPDRGVAVVVCVHNSATPSAAAPPACTAPTEGAAAWEQSLATAREAITERVKSSAALSAVAALEDMDGITATTQLVCARRYRGVLRAFATRSVNQVLVVDDKLTAAIVCSLAGYGERLARNVTLLLAGA